MLTNHAPLAIAEQFAMLEALHPGRIDLGIGRAPGTDPMTASAFGRHPHESVQHFPRDVIDVMGMADFPDNLVEAVIESADECPGECIFIEV